MQVNPNTDIAVELERLTPGAPWPYLVWTPAQPAEPTSGLSVIGYADHYAHGIVAYRIALGFSDHELIGSLCHRQSTDVDEGLPSWTPSAEFRTAQEWQEVFNLMHPQRHWPDGTKAPMNGFATPPAGYALSSRTYGNRRRPKVYATFKQRGGESPTMALLAFSHAATNLWGAMAPAN